MKNVVSAQQVKADDFVPLAVPSVAVSTTDYAMMFDTVTNPFVRRRVTTLDTTQTVSGKTMSSVDNSLDASKLKTVPISGTAPTSGDFLSYNGASWAPLTLTATAPAQYSSGNISLAVGSTSGTVAAGNDPRFSAPQVVVVKNSNPGAGEYTSIAAAIASITDSSASKPYLVKVDPGIYTETPMILPQWVRLDGAGSGTAVVLPATVGATPLLTVGSNSAVEALSFRGPSTTAILVEAATNCIMNRLIFSNFTTPIRFTATAGQTNAVLYNSLFAAPFTTAITVDGTALTGTNACVVVLHSNIINGSGASSHGVCLKGPYANTAISSGRIIGLTTGDGICLEDTAVLSLQGTLINLCNYGVRCANVGSGGTLQIGGVIMSNVTTGTLVVEHPATTGVVTGIMDRSKISIDPAANIAINSTDPVDVGVALGGDIYYNPIVGGVFTEISEQFTHCAVLGTIHNGEITDAGGLDVFIAAGTGYAALGVHPSHELRNVTWADTTLTLPANSISYIYATTSNIVTFAASLPDTYQNVLLGRVGTTGAAIEFIDPQKYDATHPSSKSIEIAREVFGPLFANGGTTATNASREIEVGSGEYYYSNNEITIAGLSFGDTFYTYYHSSGVWTQGTATVVDNAFYDNGTDLAAAGGKYVKHALYTVGIGAAEKYFLVYGQAQFDTEQLAIAGTLPVPPTYFSEGIVSVAAIIVQDGVAAYSLAIDLRPRPSSSAASVAAVTDHGSLTGLLDDDHPQYLLVNGTRAMTGTLLMGTNSISGATTYNGVTIETHASRHLPNGADPLTTAAPLTTLTATTPNFTGTANSFARSDHVHAIDQTTFSLTSIGGTLTVAKGGTGATTLTSGNFLQGNGTSAVTATKAVPSGAVVGTTDTQILSGKTLDSAANTLTVTNAPLVAANVNTLVNQPVMTTSSPTFASVTTTGTVQNFLNGYAQMLSWTLTTTSASATTVLTIPVATGQVVLAETRATVMNTTDSTSGVFRLSARCTNLAGTTLVDGYLDSIKNADPTGFSTAAVSYDVSGADLLIKYAGDAGPTHVVKGVTWVYYN